MATSAFEETKMGDVSTAPGTPEELEDVRMEGLTVGELAREINNLPPCSTLLSLREAAQILLNTGHAAACVVDESGAPVGVITEDDILHSYVQGAPWDTTVGEWVRGGGGALFEAPAPVPSVAPSVAPSLRPRPLRAEQPLHSALPALAGSFGGNRNFHPGRSALLVARDQGYQGGALSALDVAQSLAQSGGSMGMWQHLGLGPTMADIMAPIEEAPQLRAGFTMGEMLQELLSTPLRAALVFDQDNRIGGLCTVADALWGFEQQMARTMDAWDRLCLRPGRAEFRMPVDATPSAWHETGCLGALATDQGDVVGLLSPSQVVSGRAAPVPRPVPSSVLTSERPRKVKDSEVMPGEPEWHVKLEEEAPLEEPAPKKRAVMRKSKDRPVQRPQPMTLAEVAAHRETATCSISDTLTDAVDELVSTHRTAAVVLDDHQVQGVLTENDVLAALVEGAAWEVKISEWLRGSSARLPGFLVPALTLPASSGVADAAAEVAEMVQLAEDNLGFACHHLLVHAKEGGPGRVRILSALDIARGMVDTARGKVMESQVGEHSAKEAARLTAEQGMKQRHLVATCKVSDSLLKAFEEMYNSKQNCVLILEDEEEVQGEVKEEEIDGEALEPPTQPLPNARVLGVLTAADALRAFSEHLRGTTTTAPRERARDRAKKTWCCEHHSGGCPSGEIDAWLDREEFHCSGAEAESSAGEWSSAKRAWCCKAKVRGPRHGSFHGRATAAKRPTTAVLGLRTGRRAGAITRSTSAASTMLSPAPIRCATTATPGSPRGRRSGPRTRRRSRLHRGCQATPAYDCDLGFAQWQQSWSQLKQQWCCVQQSRGCQESAPAPAPVQVVHVVHHVHTVEHMDHVLHGDHVDYVHHSHRVEWPLYSCWEDAHWRSWSPHQRQYCCQHEHLYCDDSMDTHQHYHTHVVPYDTHTHYHTHYTTQYHTHHTHVNLPFDCAAGVSNWRSGWSSEKKSYCCETYTLGCEESDVLPMETGEVNDAVEGDATVSSGGDMDELEGQGDATVSGGGMDGLEDASTISGEMGGQGDVAVSSGGDMDGLEGDASTVSSGDMDGLEGDDRVSSGELDGLEGDASTVSSGGDMNGLEGDGSVSSELGGLEGDATISSGNMEGLEGDVSTFRSGIDGTEVASTDDGAVIN
ncbi:unnamed protein product [Effrenium voratum]|nr:unnamed protein product [Effrenium voratum]